MCECRNRQSTHRLKLPLQLHIARDLDSDVLEQEPGTQLHYWFAAAESADAASLPVVLWLSLAPNWV